MNLFRGFKAQRYGRNLSIVTGRLGVPWGLHVCTFALPSWPLIGIHAGIDREDTGQFEASIGIGVLTVTITVMPYLTKKGIRAIETRRDAFMADMERRRAENAEV